MQLITAIATKVRSGDYVFTATMTSGSASLAVSIGCATAQQITDMSYTANANGVVTLPTGEVTATLTGDATLHLSELTK